MRKRNLLVCIFAAIIFFNNSLSANPVMPDVYGTSGNDALWLLVALTSLLIEYLIVRILLSPQVKFWRTLRYFFVINLITFPLTQFLGLIFIWFAELFPLIFEPKMYRYRLDTAGIEVPNLKFKIVTANLISFALGILLYNIIPIVYRKFYY